MERKIVLITGGSSGIGKSIGKYLSQKGYTVYGTTRNVDKHPNFKEFSLLQMDVRNVESISSAFKALLLKEGRVDVLINNAGVGITGPIEETPNEEILNVFSTNFTGPINVIKGVLPLMRKQHNGLIINITSIAGYMGLPYRGIYSATKGALGLITESLRMETKDFGIKFTTLAPGDFATNIAAKKVLQIIHTKEPKVHYKVGSFLQKFSVTLKNILPSKVYEKILLNHAKL